MIVSLVLAIRSALIMRKANRNFQESIESVDTALDAQSETHAMIKEISSEHVKIKKYNELTHCGMDIEECTVLLTFNDVEEVKEFLDTHKGKNRVKMVEGDKVVKHNYCEGCEEIGY